MGPLTYRVCYATETKHKQNLATDTTKVVKKNMS